jgi:hypothetical protein
MAEWIEVPAHRIYAISERELRDDFDYIGENGRPVARGEIPYRFVRKKDGKVFKWARFAPQYTEAHNCTALEEIWFHGIGRPTVIRMAFKRSTTTDETHKDHPI